MYSDPDLQKRKIVRLLQVREQSKDIAKNLRRKFNEEREKRLEEILSNKRQSFNAAKQVSLNRLKIYRDFNEGRMGNAHADVAFEDDLKREWEAQKEYNARQATLRIPKARKQPEKIKIDNKTTKFDGKTGLKPKNTEKSNVRTEPKTDECNNHTDLNERRQIESSLNLNEPIPKISKDKLCDCNGNSNKNIPSDLRVNKSADSVQGRGSDDVDNVPVFKFKLNIATEFIENRRKANTIPTQDDVKSNENNSAGLLRDTIERSRCLNASTLIPCCPPIPVLPKTFNKTKWDDFENLFNKHSSANEEIFERRKPDHLNKPETFKSKFVKWTPKQAKSKCRPNVFKNKNITVKYYDHPNRFYKDVSVDNHLLVNRLDKNATDAFEDARKEANETGDIEEALMMKQASNKMKMNQRHQNAIEKVRVEKDYKKLIEELDVLLASNKQNLQSRQYDKSNLTSDSLKKHGNQFSASQTSIAKEKCVLERGTVNVAELDYYTRQYRSIEVTESSKNSNDSSSIIFRNESLTMIADKQNVNVPMNSNSPRQKKFRRKKPASRHDSDESSLTADDHPVIQTAADPQRISTSKNISSSTRSSVSLHGLQIVIEIKKDKKVHVDVNKKDDDSNSCKGASPKSLKITEGDNPEVKSKDGADISQSTVYMSPPDKITTNLETYSNEQLFSGHNLFFDAPILQRETVEVHRNVSMSQNMLELNLIQDKRMQVNCDQSKSTTDDKKRDLLKNYVVRLLNMPKNEVDKLKDDVSDISTPNSSVINVPTNMNIVASSNSKEKPEPVQSNPNEMVLSPLNDNISTTLLKNSEISLKPSTSKLEVLPVNLRTALEEPPNNFDLISNREDNITLDTLSSLHTSNNENELVNTSKNEETDDSHKETPPIDSAKSVDFIPMLDNLLMLNMHENNENAPIGLNRNLKNVLIPHELSTIIEVDTPGTTRNLSQSKNVETTLSQSPNEQINASHESTIKRVEPPDLEQIELSANITPYVPFCNTVDTRLESVLEENNDSSDTMTDFETWLKNNGINWGISTSKKALDSSSSSASSSLSNSTKEKINRQLLESLRATINSESSIDLSSSDELLTTDVKLEKLLKKLHDLHKSIDKKKSADRTGITMIGELPRIPIDTIAEVTKDQSKDKTNQRTSTPVANLPSLSNSCTATTSQGLSAGLFSLDGDISSVKNSSLDKGSSSDEHTLSIPNVSLKFKKLFDTTDSDKS